MQSEAYLLKQLTSIQHKLKRLKNPSTVEIYTKALKMYDILLIKNYDKHFDHKGNVVKYSTLPPKHQQNIINQIYKRE